MSSTVTTAVAAKNRHVQPNRTAFDMNALPLDIRIEIYSMVQHPATVHFLHVRNAKQNKLGRQLYNAALMNDLHALITLLRSIPSDSIHNCILNILAASGHEKALQFFYAQGKHLFSFDICASAALGGHRNVLQWLHRQKCPWNPSTCSAAARGGHLELFKWLYENGCPWDTWTCSEAARGGHLEILMWAHEHGCPWDKYTCRDAARGGYLEILKYAHENGCPWDKWTCSGAVSGGHMEILKYAYEHSCPWDTWTCREAASGGHFEILQWLHEHGCPWDKWTCIGAARGGHLEILKWAREHGCFCWDEEVLVLLREMGMER